MKLAELIAVYVAFKQAMGMSYKSEAVALKSFCKAMGNIGIEEVAPAAVESFLSGTGRISGFLHQKYIILNNFYRFALSRGYIGYNPLPKIVPKRPEPMRPYIYTTEELRRLIDAIGSLESSISPLQATTFRTIVFTLYGTGLRISEALTLTIADVRIENSLIIVRNSKFYKSRLVPIGPRLTDHLELYFEKRRLQPRPVGEDSAFFSTCRGNGVSYSHFRNIFVRLRDLSGIRRQDNAYYAPRIHDLRHTFAVHRLEAWYREGADVQRLLPRLSTYLGHVGIKETQRYLTMTPNLLQSANQRFEHYVLSEVKHV